MLHHLKKVFLNQFKYSGRIISGRLCSNKPVTEEVINNLLKQRFPSAVEIQVTDTSGGCGAMFEIFVKSNDFKGLSIVKQHKTITDTLKNEIKQIHGLRIETKVP